MINNNVKQLKLLNYLAIIVSSKLFWIISFTFLTAFAAQFTVPVKPVPFTLQTMMVLLAGALLGAKNGAISQILYLGLGAIGLPVFAQTGDSFGFARLFGPTGGYLLAFPIAAFLVGYLVEKNKRYIEVVTSMLAANILIIAIGALYLNFVYLHNFSEAIISGAAVFSVWTVVKVFIAASIYFLVTKQRNK
jgi:biotin transport system substrate-specific component